MQRPTEGYSRRPSKSSLPLIIGRKPLMEALTNGQPIEKIFMLRTGTGDELNQIKKLAREQNIPISAVPIEKLNGLTNTQTQHQGVVAYGGMLNYVSVQDAVSMVVDKGEIPMFLLLDGVTDVRNVGAIARTALCCGAQALILPISNSASLTEEAIKTSAGALSQIMLCRSPSVSHAIEELKLNGLQIAATEMRGTTNLPDADLTIPTCIVLGAEDSGVGKDVLKHADVLMRIPMVGKFNSLNVSVAAGMVLYEAVRQKGMKVES